MLDATLTTELFELEPDSDPVTELTGLGGLDRQSRRRVVRETLELVVPGLERYGIDAAPGRRWLLERIPRPPL